ncbi:cytochrome c551 [Halobacillus dabanensis]|uniref:Cytochrome c551 n=1 Tax=Halobacillus dabanensis TaxID=240302 RepID=A0A1I3RHI7_HALDA|nr:cytochrome c [Halobacillus dabanensis]SFJ45169.1 cytochrome c551 [Halobacillus dabanensis]
MKQLLFALFLGLILVLSACGGGDEGTTDENNTNNNDETTEEQTDDNAEDGSGDSGEEGTVDTAAAEEVYQANCASCHGGELGGGMGPSLTNVGADHSADDIVEIIKNGKGDMPAQKQVSDEDAELVASWLATMK